MNYDRIERAERLTGKLEEAASYLKYAIEELDKSGADSECNVDVLKEILYDVNKELEQENNVLSEAGAEELRFLNWQYERDAI